jgi:hypothetical protein
LIGGDLRLTWKAMSGSQAGLLLTQMQVVSP